MMIQSPLRISTYLWPPDVKSCAGDATLESICRDPGNSFRVLYDVLQQAGINFTVSFYGTTSISYANLTITEPQFSFINGSGDIVPYTDTISASMTPYTTYLAIPQVFAQPALLVNPDRTQSHLSTFDQFDQTTWLLLILFFILQSIVYSVLINFNNINSTNFFPNWLSWIYDFHFSRIGYLRNNRKLDHIIIHAVFYSILSVIVKVLYRKELVRNFTPTLRPQLPSGQIDQFLKSHETGDPSRYTIIWNYYPDELIQVDSEYNVRLRSVLDSGLSRKVISFNQMFRSVSTIPHSLVLSYSLEAMYYRMIYPHLCVVLLDDVPGLRYAIGHVKGHPAEEALARAGMNSHRFGIWDRAFVSIMRGVVEFDGCSPNIPFRTFKVLPVSLDMFWEVVKVLTCGYTVAVVIFALEYTSSCFNYRIHRVRSKWNKFLFRFNTLSRDGQPA